MVKEKRWGWEGADVLFLMALAFILGFSLAMIFVDNGFQP